MAIISHTLSQSLQPDGSTHNVVRMYDSDGKEYMASFFAPPVFDVSARVVALYAEVAEQLAQAEFEQTIGG